MNRDFIRPLILVVSTIVLLGVLAALIPGCEGKLIKIKPFKWFGHLINPGGVDSETAVADTVLPDSRLSELASFTQKLENAGPGGNHSIRIAYFGDSIIEGDLITARLRYDLQQAYGGTGVGWMPITSIVAGFRQTIRHSFAKNWEAVSFMSQGRNNIPLGFGGFTFIPRNYYTIERPVETRVDSLAVVDSLGVPVQPAPAEPQSRMQRVYVDTEPWVEYSGASIQGGSSQFNRIRMFYSNASVGSIVKVSYDGQASQIRSLEPGAGLKMLDLSPASPITKIRLSFSALDPIHVYGVSLDKATGLYVDNISIRGFSGMYFERIPSDLMRAFQRYLDYDLVILQYGENVSNPNTTDYSFYYKGMMKTLAHIKQNLPGVPILMVSAHDRSIKRNGQYQTSPDIPHLVNTQSRIAEDSGAGFWNLLDAMGGLNSMSTWVHNNPPLASKDFTHFNRAGANKIADMLFKLLVEGE